MVHASSLRHLKEIGETVVHIGNKLLRRIFVFHPGQQLGTLITVPEKDGIGTPPVTAGTPASWK